MACQKNPRVSQTPGLDPSSVVSEFPLLMLQEVDPRRTWALWDFLGEKKKGPRKERVPGVGFLGLSTLTGSGVPGSRADNLWEQLCQVLLDQVLHSDMPLSPEPVLHPSYSPRQYAIKQTLL